MYHLENVGKVIVVFLVVLFLLFVLNMSLMGAR